MKPSVESRGTKLCMVTAYTENPKYTTNPDFGKMARFTAEINQRYCLQHGYGFRLYNEGFAEDRHPSWSKLLFVQDALRSYPWVMWIDTDALVTNFTIKAEKFIDNDYMLVMAKQAWGLPPWYLINFGVFLASNDPAFAKFVKAVWDDISREGREGWEQDGVRQVIQKQPFKSMTKIMCRRGFNSLIYHESFHLNQFSMETETWHRGDFIAHYGWRHPNILADMQAMWKDVCNAATKDGIYL